LGFPGTLAAPFIDYLIADAEVAPPQARAHFAEKLVILPGTYQVNDTRRAIAPATPSRAALGLPETGFIYCSFNNSYKITPKVFDVWCRVLGRVEGSVLWLLADNAAATRNLRREAERRGLEPRRLVFAPRLGLPDHLSRHRAADLFLDCFDCGAHTGASDALWVGLPVLTLRGATFAGRVAASVLRAADMPDTITDAVADYETLAVALALDPGRLGDLRRRLSEHRDTCALFDAKRFTRHLEAAYAEMWHRHRAGEPPDDIVVTPLN
jgi:predicted O-linked N-acetylglucosamine transferase (SPINDLY family)